MKFIRLKNWERYQHYKKRNPIWIKLYNDMLTSQAWVTGSDASRALMVASMLLASRTQNRIPADPKYWQRIAYLSAPPDFSELVATEFIEIVDESQSASNVLASGYQDACLETEKEREKEEKHGVVQQSGKSDQSGKPDHLRLASSKQGSPSEGFDLFWKSWPASDRKVGKAKCREVWQRKRLDPLADQIVAHVQAMKGTDQWLKGYDPAPLTYLNQQRWEDGMPQTPQKGRVAL